MPIGRGRAEAARQLNRTAGLGDWGSAGTVSGRSAGAFGLGYEMRRREPHGGQCQRRRRRGRGKAGQGAERAAHRACVMFAVFAGCAVRFTMSAEQRQQTLLCAAGLDVRAAMLRRLDRLGEIEGKVDRHQRVERERKEAESRGPDPASPLSRSHSGAPALGVPSNHIGMVKTAQRALQPKGFSTSRHSVP
jgi:hypothetical protein